MEVVLDTNIYYKHRKLYSFLRKKCIPTFLNFEDLLASKENITNLDKRLSQTIKSKLLIMNLNEIFPFEPHYYIIKEIFPKCQINKNLYQRIDESDPTSFLNSLLEIIKKGSSINEDLKKVLITYAKMHKQKKEQNVKDTLKWAKKIHPQNSYGSIDRVNYQDLIPHVENLLVDNLNNYANKNLLGVPKIKHTDLNFEKIELFIKVFSKYISEIIKGNETPAYNDNIDYLLLLYVNNERKFITLEKKWLRWIIELNLHRKYLIPFSSNAIDYSIKLFLLEKFNYLKIQK